MDTANPLLKQEQRMHVCEVCGGFLVVNDAAKRLEAHYEGKQHTGYARIRETHKKLRVSLSLLPSN